MRLIHIKEDELLCRSKATLVRYIGAMRRELELVYSLQNPVAQKLNPEAFARRKK